MDAFSWIGEIIQAVLKIVPRLIIVDATQAGVAWRVGNRIISLTAHNGLPFPRWRWPFFARSGLHIYWPVITNMELVDITRQPVNLAGQCLLTQDGKAIGVSGIVVYEVDDCVTLLTQFPNYDDLINDLALATIKEVVTKHSRDHLTFANKKFDTELTAALREKLKPMGLRIIRVTLSDLAPARVISLWSNTTGAPDI